MAFLESFCNNMQRTFVVFVKGLIEGDGGEGHNEAVGGGWWVGVGVRVLLGKGVWFRFGR